MTDSADLESIQQIKDGLMSLACDVAQLLAICAAANDEDLEATAPGAMITIDAVLKKMRPTIKASVIVSSDLLASLRAGRVANPGRVSSEIRPGSEGEVQR
tara:strand:+ start:775 stop:1077 length:303 start_codon:yes stop_codon:yes gene_type:complete